MWLIFTLLAAVLWGVGQIFVKKGFDTTSSLFSNVYTSLLGFVIFIPFALSHGVHFEQFWQLFPFTCFISFLLFSYYYALNNGQLALTGTIVGMSPFVTVLLSFLFLGERLSTFQFIAITLIILGTIFVALPTQKQKVTSWSWLFWAILAVCMIGTADFLVKGLLNHSDIYTYLFTYGFGSLLISVLFIFLDKKGGVLPPFKWGNYLPTLLGAGMVEVGFFVFQLAINAGLVSLVSPVSSIYIAITAILAWLILKEKIAKKHWFGIALSAFGVILIGIS